MVEIRQQHQESSVSSGMANIMCERLEKEAREREVQGSGCSVDKKVGPFLDQLMPSEARKRGASQLDGDCKLEESPQKLLKMSSAPEDEKWRLKLQLARLLEISWTWIVGMCQQRCRNAHSRRDVINPSLCHLWVQTIRPL